MTALADEGDPSTALFTSFTRMAAQAAGKKTVIDLHGTGLAHRDGPRRHPDPEVMALLTSTCQGTLQG